MEIYAACTIPNVENFTQCNGSSTLPLPRRSPISQLHRHTHGLDRDITASVGADDRFGSQEPLCFAWVWSQNCLLKLARVND